MKKLTSAALAAIIAASVLPWSASADTSPLMPKGESPLIWDEGVGYVKGIADGTTAAQLSAYFDGNVTVRDADGSETDGAVGTDYTVSDGERESKTLVYGDVNRDGKINAKDVSAMMKKSAGMNVDINMTAHDVNLDGAANMKDAATLMKYAAGWNVTLGYVGWGLDLDPIEAEAEDYTLELYFTDPTSRTDPAAAEIGEARSYLMHLARNEEESVNANLYSYMGHEGLNATLTPFADKYGNTLETELLWQDYFYIDNSAETVPDRLPPMQTDFALKEMTNQALYVSARTNADSAAGLYRARLSVTDADGNEIKCAYIYADVWDFAITEETHMKTAMGMGAHPIISAHIGAGDFDMSDPNAPGELYGKYYEYMLRCRLNPWCTPYDPLDDADNVWLDDPRVNTVNIVGGYAGDMYGGGDADYVAKVYDKFKDHPDWLKKALFYIVDEPISNKPAEDHRGHVEDMMNWEATLDGIWPGARQIVPVAVNEVYDINGERGDTLALCANHCPIICPCTTMFIDPTTDFGKWMSEYSVDYENAFGKMQDRYDGWKAEGKECWTYTANNPVSPTHNMDLENTGMEIRTMFWDQFRIGSEGFLYWETTGWGASNGASSRLSGSDGILVYCGVRYGINGPIACLRAEIVRDSIEDYEYLWLAEQLWGRETALEWAHRICTDEENFERDFAALEAVRIELGDALEAACR